MESVCRGCNQQCTSLASIFIPYTMDLFQQCTALNICNDDGLPGFICKSCNDRCEQWLKFKEMCHQNNEIFRQNKYNSSWPMNNTITNENIKIELLLKQELESSVSNDEDDDDYDNYVDEKFDCDENEPTKIKQNENIEKVNNVKINKTKKTTTKSVNKSNNNIKKHKEKKVMILKCDECSRILSSRSNLIKHLKQHGEKQFICSYCGIRFHTNSSLNQHIRIHTGDKPFKCDLCSSAFKQAANLIVHRRKHNQEKPYKCDKCLNSYFTIQQLKLHNLGTDCI